MGNWEKVNTELLGLMEHKKPEFVKKFPLGKVPALEHIFEDPNESKVL